MTRVRVESFAISLDGFGAGPNQDVDNPLGIGGAVSGEGANLSLFIERILQYI